MSDAPTAIATPKVPDAALIGCTVGLERITRRLRDMECSHRKSADYWHNSGAPAQASVHHQVADALESVVRELIATE